MGKYVSTRFENPKANELAERINGLGPWLSKSPYKKVRGKWVESIYNGLGLKKIINQKLETLKTNIPQSEIDKVAKGLKILYSTGNYNRDEIIKTYESLKNKKLVYVDGEWHFVNKLNTNWSDTAELITELIVRMGDLDKVYEEENIKEYLYNIRGNISSFLDKNFKDKKDYLNYTNNSRVNSAAGEEAEDVIEGFLSDNGFEILYRGGNGDFLDMIYGTDIIVKHPKHGIKTIQVKENTPNWDYNVDWVGIGNGIKIYDNKTKEDITNTLIEDKGDEMVESFFDTGKLINEIGDEETMGKLKRDIETIEKKSFDDLVSEYEIGKYMNQFKDSYNRQKNTYVYDKKRSKLTLVSFNDIWEEIFKLIQNLYILDLYKNVGKPSLGLERDKRIGNYGSLISSIVAIVDKYVNNDESVKLTKLLSNLNDYIEKLTMNEELIPKLRNDLWAIIDKVKDKGGVDILSLLSKKVSSYSEYEDSFLKRGFSKPIGKKAEGRIHDLKGGELSVMINSESTEEEIFNYVKNNIEKYVSSVDNIEKYDIISDRDFMLGDKTLINNGDKIEIKKNKHSEGQDSYYSEPLASPVKSKYSNIRTDKVLKQKYTNVIDKLFNWLGGSGKSIGEDILKKLVKGTKGIFLENYIFIPIENVEFYLSNRGYNNCLDHRRLAIRYRLKPGKSIYKLSDDNNFEEIPYSGETEISKDYKTCDGSEPKVKVDGSQIIQENSDFISEYVENFLDL